MKKNITLLVICIFLQYHQISIAVETENSVTSTFHKHTFQNSIEKLQTELQRIERDLSAYSAYFDAARQDAIFLDEQIDNAIESYELCKTMDPNPVVVQVCNEQTKANFLGVIREHKEKLKNSITDIETKLKKAQKDSESTENITKLIENYKEQLQGVDKVLGIADKYSNL